MNEQDDSPGDIDFGYRVAFLVLFLMTGIWIIVVVLALWLMGRGC